MSLIQTVHLKVADYSPPQVIHAVQNDTDRSVKMVLDDYELTSGLTGKMTFLRADGTYYEASAVLDVSTNSFTAELDQALTYPGRTLAQLKVTDTDSVSTFSFAIFVHRDTSGVVSEQEGISLLQAVADAEDAARRAEEAAAGGGSGITDEIKEALLACFEQVAWVGDDGQDYYDALYAALYSSGESYSVTNNLTNVTNSNNATSVNEGSQYTARLSAISGYISSVTITMGGVDVTNSVYTPGD